MNLIDIIGGALLLTLGRKIFWFFVALTGFYLGLQFANQYLNITPAWLGFLIAIIAGLIGAVLAYFFQKALIGIAGFLAGALLAGQLLNILAIPMHGLQWLVILIGGIIGIVLMIVFFDWALIILSSLIGAILIVQGFSLAGVLALIVGLILFVAGVIFQSRLNRRYVPPATTTNAP